MAADPERFEAIDIEEAPDGSVWVLEDERGESQGRLLKLTPRD